MAYILTFSFENAVTTIRIVLKDSSGADMVITNMTTLPIQETGKGYGSVALSILLEWALNNNLNDIRAVQVQGESEGFWVKNKFASVGNFTNDFLHRKET